MHCVSFFIELFSVKIFAEGEFFFSLIKVLAVIAFIGIGAIGIIYQIYSHGFGSILIISILAIRGFSLMGAQRFLARCSLLFCFHWHRGDWGGCGRD